MHTVDNLVWHFKQRSYTEIADGTYHKDLDEGKLHSWTVS